MRRVLQLLAAALFIVCPVSTAQTNADVEQGLIPYGAYQHGDVDSVNLANGNVTIHIPLLSYPQRGGKLGLSFSVIANNKGWFVYNSGTNLNWRYPNPNPNSPPGGPSGVTSPVEDHSVSIAAKILKVTDYAGTQWLMHTYAILTADGSSHEIVSTDGEGLLVNYGETIDASGQRFEKATNTVVSSGGVRVSTSATTDPNGNQITIGTGGWTDTIGRVIPPMLGTTSSTANCPTGTAVAYLWTVPAFNAATATYKFCYANYNYQTSFGETVVNEFGGTTQLLSAVVLPNLTKWQFTYDSYANVTSVAFPTGGSITYIYGNATLFANKSRVVTTRKLNANDGTGDHTTNYQWNVTVGGQAYNVVTDPAGNDTLNQVCNGNAYVCVSKYYSGSYSSSLLLKTVTNQYHSETDPYDQYTQSGASANVVLTSTTTAWSGGKTNQTTTNYDPGFTYYIFQTSDDSTSSFNGYYGKPTLRTFSDYGSGAPGSILKQVSTSYKWQTDSNYTTENLLSLVAASKLLDVNGNLCAETDYAYDDTSRLSTPNPAVTMQHVAAPGSKRGNLSSVTQQLTATPCQSGASWRGIPSYVNAYDTGTTYQSVDPLGHTTTYTYSPTFYGAYPTQTQLNNTSTPGTGTIVQHISSANYDFNTGLLKSATDENGNSTNLTSDNMSRLTLSSYPDAGSLSFAYQDSAPFKVTSTRKITASMNKVTAAVVDGVGRLSQTQFVDPNCTVGSALIKQDFVHTEDTVAHDRLTKTSTPYCDSPGTIFGLMSVSHSDPLGRVKSLVQTDNSTATMTYADNLTTATDEAGKSRKTQTDGLGRVTAVWEDPAGLNYETDYTYDPLGNLLTVNQKGNDPNSADWRTRTFTYDSLSRLLTSSNPESGSITYAYNDDSTLATKTAPKPNQTGTATVVTTYAYDEIHRITTKSFNDGTTPTVKYTYDAVTPAGCTPPSLTITNGIGRRTSMCDAGGSEAWSYDVMGRALTEKRITNSVTKTTSYTYNLDGSSATLTNPSGRVITYAYNAAARPVSAVDVSNSINYVTAAAYAPTGAISSLTNNASFVETNYYNSRLQPCRISVKSSGTAPTQCSDAANIGGILDYTYNFNLGVSDNGNVAGITNNQDTTRSQSFTYDSLNRLSTAKTASTSGTKCWDEQFGYDPWANLQTIGRISGYTCANEELLNASATTKNQISGYTYDAAGNLINDGLGHAYTFNAESQLLTAAGVTYTYDGDGKRVKKSTGTLYWYGAGSDALSETDSTGVLQDDFIFFAGARIARYYFPSSHIFYYFADHLGTARSIVQSGTTTACYDADFYPFGGERSYINTCTQWFKFTGKERDSESGLDNIGARFDSSNIGRFVSSDQKQFTVRHIAFPQKWNKYTYVQNRPLNSVDPDGLDDYVVFRTVTSGMNSKQWAAAEKSITSQKDAQGRQNTFRMIEGPNATVEAYRSAIATPDTHVVFVGHATETETGHGTETVGIRLDNGDSSGKNGSTAMSLIPGGTDSAPTMELQMSSNSSDWVSAASVALFGCDTYSLASQYDTTNFTGVQSGPDGTALQTLDVAAAAWVGAGGGQAGDAAANGAIQNSQYPIDTGDNVESERPEKPDPPQ